MNEKNHFFKICIGILLVLGIIFMASKVSFIFEPLVLLFKTLLTPFLIAGVLYYILLPVYTFLLKRGMSKTLAIVSIYGASIGVLAMIVYFLVPAALKQLNRMLENAPALIKKAQTFAEDIFKSDEFKNLNIKENIDLSKITAPAIEYSNKILGYVGDNVIGLFTTATDFVLLIIVIPFLLFYLLKENDKVSTLISGKFREKHQPEIKKILSEANTKLSFYIQGQLLVSFILGVLLYIGYEIIGLDYALILAIVAMFANIIPFLGPTIGLVFALAVALTQSIQMVVLVFVVVMIVQAIDSNYISPKVLGDKLDIHPLTIIFILLFAGNLGGILAMLVAVPAYSIGKVLVQNGYRIIKLSKNEKNKKKNPFID